MAILKDMQSLRTVSTYLHKVKISQNEAMQLYLGVVLCLEVIPVKLLQNFPNTCKHMHTIKTDNGWTVEDIESLVWFCLNYDY